MTATSPPALISTAAQATSANPTEAETPPAGHPRVWLALILTLAALLRFTGLGWGLPDIDVRPDEELTVTMALRFGSGDLNPHWFWYPTFQGYLLFGLDILLAVYWKLTGVISSPGDILTRYAVDPSAFYLIARSLSAVSGTATVLVVYLLGRRVYGTPVGVAAAFILAVAFLPVRDSHFGTVDPPMIFLATLAMLPAWSIYERPNRRAYLQAGALVGLATSSKYYGVVSALAVAAAHFLRPRGQGETRRNVELVISGSVCAGVFLATSPFVVLAFPEFLRDFRYLRRLQAGLTDDYLMQAWKVHLLYSLPLGLTWPIFLASAAGLVGLCLTDLRRSVVLYVYPLAFFGVVGASWIAFARYVTPAVPFLALTAGWLVCRAAGATSRALGGGARSAKWLRVGFAAALCSQSLLEDGFLLHHFRAPDTRRQAAVWVCDNVRDGSTVGWLGSIYGRPPLPQSAASYERRLADTLARGRAGALSRKRIELARAGRPPLYLLIDLPRDPGEWTGDPPEYLMTEKYPLFYAAKEVALADRWVRLGGYEEVKRWAVTDRTGPFPYSDPQDAVYLPYGDLGYVERSGPELVLYRRRVTSPAESGALPPDRGGWPARSLQ